MKKWAFAITVAFFAVVSVAAGTVALTDDDGGDNGQRVARDADGGSEEGGDGDASDCAAPPCEDAGGRAAGICLEGTVDCIDTPTEKPPEGDGVSCIDISPPPSGCWAPDEPVSNEPPASDPGDGAGSEPGAVCTMQYPNECTGTAAAVADLAARLDIAEDTIAVLSVGFVEWPDACLGVAQPDVACAEVITTGYRIILQANGQTYEYHTDGGSRAVLAE